MHISTSDEYIVPDAFIKLHGNKNLLDSIAKGTKYIVFPYVTSFIWVASKKMSRPYIVNDGTSLLPGKIKYNLITLSAGFWLNIYGIIWSIKSIIDIIKGGYDVTYSVKERCIPEEQRLRPILGGRDRF
jgi:hypothetical protein